MPHDTKGPVHTIKLALEYYEVNNDEPLLCLDVDNFYTVDIISLWNMENVVFTFKDVEDEPIFSYVKTNTNKNIITDIVEKEKISNNACCGAYGFSSIYKYIEYANKTLENNLQIKGEFYTSTIVQEMIKDKIVFKNTMIPENSFFSLGTPKLVKQYVGKTKKHHSNTSFK